MILAQPKDTEQEFQLLVTQIRSGIGTKPKHRGTLRALGLGRVGQRRLLPDRPEIRGMIARVTHLVTVARHPAGAGEVGATGPVASEKKEAS